MRRLECGDDTLELTHEAETNEGLGVGGGDVFGALAVLPGAELGADTRVVQTGGDGVRFGDLAMLVLENVGLDAVQNTLAAAGESGTVARSIDAIATSLNTEELDARIVGKGVEHADSVAATADAGDNGIGQLAPLLEHLRLGLVTDDRLEGTDNGREGVRANGGTDDVVSGVELNDPGAHGLVHGVAEGLASGLNGDNLGAEKLHAEDVEGLTADVFSTHIDCALHAKLGADGGRGDTVLAGAGLGDDLGLAEALGEEELAKGVVDLVGAGVVEILTLQPDVGTAGVLGEALGEVEVAGAAHVLVVGTVLLPEGRIVLDLVEALLELRQAVHERLGDVLASKVAEAVGDLAVHGGELGDELAVLIGGDTVVDGGLLGGLLGGGHGLDHANLAGGLIRVAAAEVGAVLCNVVVELAGGGLLEGGDDLGADDDTVGELGDAEEVVASADTETDGSRLVAAVLLDAGNEVGEVGVHGAEGTGDTLAGDDVDEGVGQLAKDPHAGV